jgi:hypothetical protein
MTVDMGPGQCLFVTTPGLRINVAPSCGLFLTCRESEQLKITLICTYIQNNMQKQVGRITGSLAICTYGVCFL